MSSLWHDVQFGLRTLRKSPGFTLVALITLALGIGANTAIFSVVDAVLLHPLPYPDPGRITALYRTNLQKHQEDGTFSLGLFTDLRGHIPGIEEISAYHVWPLTITGPGEPTEVGSIASSASMFRLLGIRPIAGRPFTETEDKRGAPPVALISETLWHKRFTGSPSAIGKAIDIAGEPYTIIGVFPAGLRFPGLGGQADVWIPLTSDPAIKSFAGSMVDPNKVSYLGVLGRLKPGVSLVQAKVQADTVAAALVKADSKDRQGMGLRVSLLEQEVARSYRTALGVLLGAVGLVLLIACANVANLLVARATTREREMALRLALGAPRLSLVRQMLIESIEVGLAGGAIGAYLAYLAVGNLSHWIPSSLTQFHAVTVNLNVLLFAAAVSLGAGILSGSLPALQLSDLNVYATLKEGGRGSAGGAASRRLRETLVVVEVALAVMLLAGAGLLLRSFSRLLSTNPGFDPQGIAVASVNLPRSAYRSPEQWSAFVSNVLDHLRAEPGVNQAAAAVTPPAGGIRISLSYTVSGQPAPPPGQEPIADYRPVTPGYFALMHIPLVAGRDLATSDSASSTRVCVINQALASVSLPGINPIGRSLTGMPKPCQIVGVVGNVKMGLEETAGPAIYAPFDQSPFWVATFLARGSLGTTAILPLLRDSVRSMDRNLPADTTTLVQRFAGSANPVRFRADLIGIFAGLAILLAAAGISGVLGYSVSRQTQEIGVRMALGATPEGVLRKVVGEGLRLVGIGAAVGFAAALAVTHFMRSMLYGVGPADPVTYAGAAVLLLVVALLSCALPALRASRIDPNVALRYE
ncbi:MAG: ABC transporter permease [Acidobacteriota bacterium]|nr:ABC transporter permease [Acidobacteriota bacterium]